jgi:hypothetical protein
MEILKEAKLKRKNKSMKKVTKDQASNVNNND